MEPRKWCILVCFLVPAVSAQVKSWSYTCDEYDRCVRQGPLDTTKNDPASPDFQLSLGRCKLVCGDHAVLWPRPREARLGKTVRAFELDDVVLANKGEPKGPRGAVAVELENRIDEQIEYARSKKPGLNPNLPAGDILSINVVLERQEEEEEEAAEEEAAVERFRAGVTNETYAFKLSYAPDDRVITAEIRAAGYHGARHGLETLFQLVEFDCAMRAFVVLDDVDIRDYPEFVHRGIMLDTSRNFITVDVIKRLIRGMAHSKLNVLHWHIVDTHSYPMEQKREPINLMHKLGAYSSKEYYKQKDVKELVRYANVRGVTIIPEFDQPAHIGHGWEFPGVPGAEKYTVCVNREPWYDYCVEPPCGQLNPGEPAVYDILGKIYAEWYDMFQFHTFHLGADEIDFRCWNSSKIVTDFMEENGIERTEEGFIQIWSEFLSQSAERLRSSGVPPEDLQFIVWTSHLTQEKYIDNINNNEYIVQIWTDGSDVSDPQIKVLADKGYRMIFSNVDALYMDCGYGAWIGEKNNWCSPYKGWQKVYENDPYKMLADRGIELIPAVKKLVLGGEVAMWSEQVDSEAAENKIFPRAAALAERLWSSPSEGWYAAEQRMLQHRLRLVHRGVRAERLQPEWCRQNSGQCYGSADNPFVKEEKEDPQK